MAKPLTLPPLSNAQVTELRHLYETAAHTKLRLRAQIVLLAHQGRTVAEIAAIMARLKAAGTTMLMVEQNIKLALDVADRFLVLRDGIVAERGGMARGVSQEAIVRLRAACGLCRIPTSCIRAGSTL